VKAARVLGNSVELAVGDLSDTASIRRALEGVDVVFLTSGDGPLKVEQETSVIDAAAAAGVRRIVKLSTVGAEVGAPVAFWGWHGQIEHHLRQSAVPAVILQANFYMSNLLASAGQVRSEGKLYAPADGARIAMIDPGDVAAVAAVALTADGHEGQTYLITGPEAITYGHVAAELSTATGRRIEFVDVPDEAARQSLLATGMPDWFADGLVAAFRAFQTGATEQTTDTVRALTGREPRSFAQFAHAHARLFQ
jgi:uncharacterized protein YbjT (DUF2867 family)